jgi:hypothetical protein
VASVYKRRTRKIGLRLICLTPENLTSPWLLFEAGALAKKHESRVCTYLHAVKFEDVKDPLSQFQHTQATEADTNKLIRTINRALQAGTSLTGEHLEETFKMWWPKLEKVLSGIQMPSASAPPERTEGDKISEILTTVRALESVLVNREISDVSEALEALEAQVIERKDLQEVLLEARARVAALRGREASLLAAGQRGVEHEDIYAAEQNVRALEKRIATNEGRTMALVDVINRGRAKRRIR